MRVHVTVYACACGCLWVCKCLCVCVCVCQRKVRGGGGVAQTAAAWPLCRITCRLLSGSSSAAPPRLFSGSSAAPPRLLSGSSSSPQRLLSSRPQHPQVGALLTGPRLRVFSCPRNTPPPHHHQEGICRHRGTAAALTDITAPPRLTGGG